MRRCMLLWAILVIGLQGAGCAAAPSDVLEALESAASEGNAERFAQQFTKESRPFAEALLSLYQTRYPLDSRKEFSPLRMLGRSEVLDEEVRGDSVVLRVKLESSGEKANLVFKKEDGAWRLDLRATDQENSRDTDMD